MDRVASHLGVRVVSFVRDGVGPSCSPTGCLGPVYVYR